MGGIRLRYVALAVVGIVVVAALAPTVAARPSLDVTIDGTGVQDGDAVTVTGDPTMEIDASANASIGSVRVEVDGTTRRSFEPGSETFSERLTLDLQDGEHEVSVVAEAAEVRRSTVTIRKDSTAPLVTYRSPFESQGYPSNGRVTVEGANATLAAALHDLSAIDQVRIERNYEWTFASQSERDRRTYRLDEPGSNLSQPILFGLGENEFRVEVIDAHGQRRTHPMTVVVVDGARPAIDLDRFERVGNGEFRVEGTVSDDVKVNSLQYRVTSTGDSKYVVNPTTKEPNRDRLETDFGFTATVNDETESILLEATDVAGNSRRWRVPLDYRGHLEPTVSIDGDATGVDGDAVAVEGLVADGRVTRVVVEAVGPDGSVVDAATAYDGEATERVAVRERVGAASGETTVVIRAVDAAGREYRASLALATPSTPPPTERPTTEPAPQPTTTVPVADGGDAADGAAAGGGGSRGDGGSGGGGGPSLPLVPPLLVFGVIGTLVGVVVVAAVRRIDWSGLSLPTSADREGSTPRTVPTDRGDDDDPYGPLDGSGGDADADADDGGGADDAEGTERPEATPGSDADGTVGGSVERFVERHSVAEVDERDVAAAVDRLGADDVSTLVDFLDADDTETVVLAVRLLRETAADRPDLVADSDAKPRLRDLRLSSEEAVVEEANRAVREFDRAGLY
jgi:hypothetical protein